MIDFTKINELARDAGNAILEIYKQDFATYTKADESPLTEADLTSHNVIVTGLEKLTPEIPVLSEEAADVSWQERKQWAEYWLIDPLDGTKEFIKKNGEFTVNIALIKNGEPIWGVVYAPVLDCLYSGGIALGSSVKETSEGRQEINVAQAPVSSEVWKLVGSRSHQSEEFAAFVNNFENPEIISMGSSLKLCMIAEGTAHLYPRLGLTSEWDTAAADAVLRGAGGQCLQVGSLKPVTYNQKENILNPFFICCAEVSDKWKGAAQGSYSL
jgi:3'(2'), 5'-bisphosphate nucleotidase